MNIDYKISTLSIVAIYSLRFQIIFLHGLQYCQGAGWWQAAKFEIIQLKTTARARAEPQQQQQQLPQPTDSGIKMSWMLLLASHTIMLLDNFNQEIRKFWNFLQLYLNLTLQIEEKMKTF